MSRRADSLTRCLAALREHGLLLAADTSLPSVTTIVAGGSVPGSWWKHPAGRDIFRVHETLDDHEDVLVLRLVGGKVTFVARRLWPDLLAVSLAREAWQTKALAPRAAALLAVADQEGFIRVDERPEPDASDLARDLETRLLALGGQIHTESGAHARTLTSWRKWAKDVGVQPTKDVEAARSRLDDAARSLGPGARLPWTPKPPRRGRPAP